VQDAGGLPVAADAEAYPKGTYNCPVCGWNVPHREHAGDIIERLMHERRRVIDAVDGVFRRVGVAAQVLHASFPPGLASELDAALTHYKWVSAALSAPSSPTSPTAETLNDSTGLSIDMSDADRLRAWADLIDIHGADLTRWGRVAFVVTTLRAMANGVEQAVRDLGALRKAASSQATPPKCAHGHTTRRVGCVSCVLVFDRPAAASSPATPTDQPPDLRPPCCEGKPWSYACACGCHLARFDRDRESTCEWNCTKEFPHDGPCAAPFSSPAPSGQKKDDERH
jgi:hypothetical protein